MPRTSQRNVGDGIWAVALAFQLLEALAKSEKPRRLTDLAAELGTSKPRIFRHLNTLKALGYVEQERETDRYLVGVRLAMLGSRAAHRFDLVNTSRPVLQELRDAIGLTVVISKIEDGKVLIADKLDGESAVSFNAKIGSELQLHCTAQGKLVLAYSDPELLASVIARGPKALTPHTITEPHRLRAEVARVRDQGWASAPNQSLTGLNAIAVPVFNADDRLAATIGVLGSVDEIGAEPSARELKLLTGAAEEIARLLYGRRKEEAAG